MKKLVLACTALGLLAAAPASAQEFRLRAGPDGVVIRNDGDRWNRYPDRRVIERRVYRDEPRAYRGYRDQECRIVVTRRERPNGTIVERRRRICE